MTNAEIFNKLFNGGKFALPYLIKFSHSVAGDIYLVNNNEAIEYEGNTYAVSSFNYTPPNNIGEGASLSITSIDNTIIEWAEKADSTLSISVVGVIAGDSVQAIHNYKHFFGSISYDDNMSLEFTLGSDDRLNMSFTPYVYDTDNNRGNA